MSYNEKIIRFLLFIGENIVNLQRNKELLYNG